MRRKAWPHHPKTIQNKGWGIDTQGWRDSTHRRRGHAFQCDGGLAHPSQGRDAQAPRSRVRTERTPKRRIFGYPRRTMASKKIGCPFYSPSNLGWYSKDPVRPRDRARIQWRIRVHTMTRDSAIPCETIKKLGTVLALAAQCSHQDTVNSVPFHHSARGSKREQPLVDRQEHRHVKGSQIACHCPRDRTRQPKVTRTLT